MNNLPTNVRSFLELGLIREGLQKLDGSSYTNQNYFNKYQKANFPGSSLFWDFDATSIGRLSLAFRDKLSAPSPRVKQFCLP